VNELLVCNATGFIITLLIVALHFITFYASQLVFLNNFYIINAVNIIIDKI